MKQIRKSAFETNSSSTHCLVFVSEEEWKKFENGELVLDMYEGELLPTPEDYPKQNDEGKWEYKGETYDDLFEIGDYCGEWLEREGMLYAAYTGDESHETLIEHVDGKVIASIIGWEE